VATTIRYLTKRANGQESARLVPVETSAFTIGRGSDCQLELSDLRVALLHAHVSEISPGVVAVEAEGSQTLMSGGRRTRRAELHLTEPRTIEIPPYRLTFRREEGDTVVDVVREEAPLKVLSTEQSDKVFSLKGTGLSKRGAAWLLVALVAAVCLAFPLWTFGHKTAPAKAAVVAGRTMEGPGVAPQSPVMTQVNLGAGQMWTAGPLSPAHAFLSADCKSCHTAALKSVKDETCLHCHKGLEAHADAHLMGKAITPGAPLQKGVQAIAASFDKPVGRCASCHMEHQGERALLTKSQALCADCHAHLDQRLGKEAKIGNAADFATSHPQFSPTVVATPRDVDPILTRQWTAPELDRARQLREQLIRFNPAHCEGFSIGKANFRGLIQLSDRHDVPAEALAGDNTGLVFPHALHLSSKGCVASLAKELGVKTDGAGALGCASCHTASPDGKGFEPVQMERNCAACHSLTFDTQGGVTRALPHGQPQLVVASMLDFYKASTLDVVQGKVGDGRRLPGQAATDRTAQMRAFALTHADGRAADRVRAIFSPGGSCYGCHQILKPTSGLNFGVAPVVLQQHFLPRAQFDHKAHITAGMACEQCHAARQSQSAADVLMPPLETCRACHTSEHAMTKVPSTCATCHGFHVADPSAAALKGQETAVADRPRTVALASAPAGLRR
jgi:predicted CXXCH cytochrome family protein